MLYALENMWGGEMFVPKIPSYRIMDVAEAVAPGRERRICGIRPGEKLHEEMITETDALSTIELDDKYVHLAIRLPLGPSRIFSLSSTGGCVTLDFATAVVRTRNG